MRISRREFIYAAAGTTAAACFASPLGLPPGCQVFPVREQLVRDFDGTLREIAGMGYRVIEFCSPPSFVNMGFASLVDVKASELRRRIEGAGLRAVSCHFQFHELKQHLDERIDFARELGLKHMVVATLAIGPDAPMDTWRRACDDMNKLGERISKAGMQLGFHNHHFEFKQIGGVVIFDELMSRFDAKLVKSQFQVSGAAMLGLDPVKYLTKYPGRFLSLHLQDWLAEEKKEAPVGQGSIDWKKIFKAAKSSSMSYYFVEMGMDALKASAPYLRGLKA